MSLPHSLFLVIFGASGDLTRRKLMPALIKIHNGKRFPEHFAIIGCARTAYTDETYHGESTGLKPLWVIFAIVVGGALFGVLGMFLGVPVMAVICYITNLVVEHFLKKRNISVQPYDSPDEM